MKHLIAADPDLQGGRRPVEQVAGVTVMIHRDPETLRRLMEAIEPVEAWARTGKRFFDLVFLYEDREEDG